MAAMSTNLTEFSDKENNRTYVITGHTVTMPRVIIQKRKVPSTSAAQGESKVDVVFGTKDAQNMPLASKVVFSASVRYPANSDPTDVSAALAVFRDLVNSDEFTLMVGSQVYLK